MTSRELRKEIEEKILGFHESVVRYVKPIYPFVKVYILSYADQKKGNLYLPVKQNKPVYESLVVDVFEKEGQVPSVSIGDHVLFSHYQGIPCPEDEFSGDFRLLRSEDTKDHPAEIVAKLEYETRGILEEKLGPEHTNILKNFIVIDKDRAYITQSGV